MMKEGPFAYDFSGGVVSGPRKAVLRRCNFFSPRFKEKAGHQSCELILQRCICLHT